MVRAVLWYLLCDLHIQFRLSNGEGCVGASADVYFHCRSIEFKSTRSFQVPSFTILLRSVSIDSVPAYDLNVGDTNAAIATAANSPTTTPATATASVLSVSFTYQVLAFDSTGILLLFLFLYRVLIIFDIDSPGNNNDYDVSIVMLL